MTITYRTGNPVGSNSPKDLSDNASTFDELVTSPLDYAENRLGVLLLTLSGQRRQVDEALRNIGYIRLGDYDDGPITITLPNQIFSKDGEFWVSKPSLSLPYTTVENWTVDEPKFNPIGDALLRQELASVGGAARVLFTPSGTSPISRTVQAKLQQVIGPGDFPTAAESLAATFSDTGRFFLNNRAAFTLTVGPGGQFATINEAIDAAVRARPTHSKGLGNCEIRQLSGFVMREQVLLQDGANLGWIKLTSVDPMVLIDPAYITEPLSLADDSYPAFGAIGHSTLPVIATLYHYTSNASARDGVAVMKMAKVLFEPGAGVVRSRRGLLVFYGAEAACYPLGLTQGGDGTGAGLATGVDFSYARLRALHAAYGAKASLGRSMLHHCDGDLGAYVIWGAQVDLYQSNASYCVNGTAFLARDGGVLNCRESNGARSKRAFHALHNGRLNARSRISGPTMIWIGEGAQYCTEYGVLSSGNSQVEASELNASFCSGSAGVSASNASSVSFINGVARQCLRRAVWCQSASNIDATAVDFSGSATGLECMSGEISADGAIGTGCSEIAALATGTGRIGVASANLSGSKRAIEPRDDGSINARGANLSNCTERAVSAIDGGTAKVQGANCSNAGSRAITCRGGTVVATEADCSGAINWAIEVLDGGIVKGRGSLVGSSPINVAPNTVTADGIVFR